MKYYTGFWGHLSRDIMHKKRSFGKVSFAEMTRGGVEYFSPEKAGAVPPSAARSSLHISPHGAGENL